MDAGNAVAASHGAQAHACFRLEIRFPLALPAGLDPVDLWHALSYRIVREPGDLLAHVRRILLCRHADLHHYLAGALNDLFIATGDAGRALKQRMLTACAAALEPQVLQQFQARLSSAASSKPPAEPIPGSVLPTITSRLRQP